MKVTNDPAKHEAKHEVKAIANMVLRSDFSHRIQLDILQAVKDQIRYIEGHDYSQYDRPSSPSNGSEKVYQADLAYLKKLEEIAYDSCDIYISEAYLKKLTVLKGSQKRKRGKIEQG